MSVACTPPILQVDQQSNNKKRFFPAYGRTSLMFAFSTIFFAKVFSFVIQGLSDWEIAAEIPEVRMVLSILVCSVILVTNVAAVVFGMLSLLGLGKIDGKCHRVSGFFGLVMGVALLSIWGLVGIDARAAHGRESQKSIDNTNNTQQGILELYQHVETGLTVTSPGSEWRIYEGTQAKAVNPLANVVVVKGRSLEQCEEVGVIIIEAIEQAIPPDVDLVAFAGEMAAMSPLANKKIEFLGPSSVDGHPAGKHVLTGDVADGQRARVSNVFLIHSRHLIQISASASAASTTIDDPDFDAIHNSVRVPLTSSQSR